MAESDLPFKPESLAKMDQALAILADNLPSAWRRMYKKCIKVGFSPTESFKLLQTYILSQCPFGIRGADG